MTEQVPNQCISKSAELLTYPDKSSRFHITRVARTGIEEFDPLSDESQEMMELTVTELRKSQTESLFPEKTRRGSIQKGRFCVTRELRSPVEDKHLTENQMDQTSSSKPIIDPDDDLLKF